MRLQSECFVVRCWCFVAGAGRDVILIDVGEGVVFFLLLVRWVVSVAGGEEGGEGCLV